MDGKLIPMLINDKDSEVLAELRRAVHRLSCGKIKRSSHLIDPNNEFAAD
jgi:hypothetical protein